MPGGEGVLESAKLALRLSNVPSFSGTLRQMSLRPAARWSQSQTQPSIQPKNLPLRKGSAGCTLVGEVNFYFFFGGEGSFRQ